MKITLLVCFAIFVIIAGAIALTIIKDRNETPQVNYSVEAIPYVNVSMLQGEFYCPEDNFTDCFETLLEDNCVRINPDINGVWRPIKLNEFDLPNGTHTVRNEDNWIWICEGAVTYGE